MDKLLSTLWHYVNDASKLIAPQRCVLCRRRLRNHENQICLSCYMQLPFTHLKGEKGNKIERYLWEQFPIVRANSFLRYLPNSQSSHIFLQLKYQNRPQIGVAFGKMMAQDLIDTDFFDNIDCILPIPLAKERLRKRGYNQSEALARGIQAVTHIPLDLHSVIRKVSNRSQTEVSHSERTLNVKNIFELTEQQTVAHKHVLIVDDILTTGATIISCAHELMKAEDVKISILTLGLAISHFSIERIPEQMENPIKYDF